MAFNDTFTTASTTLCTAHTSDSGGTWLHWAGATPDPSVYASSGGALASGAAGAQVVRASVISTSPDAPVLATAVVDTNVASASFGICSRLNAAGTAGYLAAYGVTSQKWGIYRLGAALATTVLGTQAGTSSYAAASTPAIEFIVTGTGATVTLELKVNGVSILTATDTSASRIVDVGYPGIWFKSFSAAANGWFFGSFSNPDLVAAATAITVSGPITGTTGVASTNFTVGANGTITSTITVTPSDAGAGGTFTPATVNISSGTPTATFTYTPASDGAKTLTVTNNGGLTNPGSATYTATSSAATALALSGPGSGVTGTASANFSVAANGTLSGSVTVTPSDSGAGGTFTPSSFALSSGTPTGTFTYTPASAGAKSITIGNSGGLTNPSAITYTSLAASVTAPFPPAMADRVRDVATVASGASVTLAGTPPSGFRSFAASFAIGTKNIPALVEDTAGAWMVARCTLSSTTTLTVESIDSSSTGGTAPTFGGTLSVFVVMPAKVAFKARTIDLSEYAIYPDFSLDSTAGIQAAINDAYSRRIEKIIAPPGHFKLAGALIGSGNTQIQTPNTREGNPNRSIWIDGVCPPNFQNQGLRAVTPADNGTLFESTITGSGTRPSVFGAEQGDAGDAWRWNYTNFMMTNCGIRTKANGGSANSMSAINMEFVSQVPLLDNLMIGVNTPLTTMTNPTGGGSIGINLPPVDNHAWFKLGTVYISGYETGIQAGEHTYIDHAVLLGCVNGLRLRNGHHASRCNMLTMEHVKNSIVVDGNHPLSIGLYETEHSSSISWCTHTYDILVNAGTRAIAILRASVVNPGIGYTDSASDFHTSGTSLHKIVSGTGAN